MDELELQSAEILLCQAVELAGEYNIADDLDAATIALLMRALELAKEPVENVGTATLSGGKDDLSPSCRSFF